MFTVLHRAPDGGEIVVEAVSVSKTGEGVCIAQRDGGHTTFYAKAEQGSPCEVFVMNEAGATVARYRI